MTDEFRNNRLMENWKKGDTKETKKRPNNEYKFIEIMIDLQYARCFEIILF